MYPRSLLLRKETIQRTRQYQTFFLRHFGIAQNAQSPVIPPTQKVHDTRSSDCCSFGPVARLQRESSALPNDRPSCSSSGFVPRNGIAYNFNVQGKSRLPEQLQSLLWNCAFLQLSLTQDRDLLIRCAHQSLSLSFTCATERCFQSN
jgi:hypothetical protein